MGIKYEALHLAIAHKGKYPGIDAASLVKVAREFEAYLSESQPESGEIALEPPNWSNRPIEHARYGMWPIVAPEGDAAAEEGGHGI